MSWVQLLGAVLLATGLNAYPYGGSEYALMHIRNVIKNRCIRNADINAFINLENNFLNSHSLFGGIQFSHNPSNQELVDLTCTEVRPKAYRRMVNIAENLEPCLDLDEKYLVDVIIKTHNSSYDNDCKDDGKILLDELEALKSAQCNAGLYSAFNKIGSKCISPLKIIQHLDDINYVWVIEDFCSDLESLRVCIEDYLKTICNHHEKLLHAFNSEFGHLLNSCNRGVLTNEV